MNPPAAILCSLCCLLLNSCAQLTKPNVPAPPPLPGIFSASGKSVIAPQPGTAAVPAAWQSFTLDWTPGSNMDGIAPDYEIVLWTANITQPLSNWATVATSAPPVTVVVPLVLSGGFSIEDIYQ